jgi:hypothetical protein
VSNPNALVSAINGLVEVLIVEHGLPPVARTFARYWVLNAASKVLNYTKDEKLSQVQDERQLIHEGTPVLPALLPPGSKEKDLGIVLTDDEVRQATEHAEIQQAKAIREGRRNHLGHARSMAAEITGALGEIAVAKALKLFWERDVHGFKRPDVSGFQVRATDRSNGALIVRDNDGLEDIYILVTSLNRTNWILRGWMRGEEARAVGKFEAKGMSSVKAYWVSQKQLHPISSLPDLRTFQDARPFPVSEVDEEF